jgi:hypothetical protein
VQWFTSIILATQEVVIGKVEVQGLLGQKVSKSPPIKLGMVVHTWLDMPATWAACRLEDRAPVWPSQKMRDST